MSGLRINFRKSNIFGFNLTEFAMLLYSTFLSCGVGAIPFKFLCVMVGDSPRKTVIWKDVVRSIRSRLQSQSGRFLSVGGVVLINYVMNAIPMYTLSFHRAPRKVIKEIKSIQRKFLQKGVEGERGVNWFSWDNLCRENEDGGLGVRDIETMNVSLLMKWKCRILTEDNTVQKNILKFIYANPEVKMFVNEDKMLNKRDSIWWRNLMLINDCAALEVFQHLTFFYAGYIKVQKSLFC